MRATSRGSHVSGAERLVPEARLAATVAEVVERVRGKSISAEQVIVTIDAVAEEQVLHIRALDLVALPGDGVAACRALARTALERTGVSPVAIEAAMEALDSGPAPSGGNMRGAMIMDARSGERLEPDHERGIRASRFDWSDAAGAEANVMLAGLGLTHARTREALALASKVANAPGIVAELCWSDDPDYTAGYVASPMIGYVRFPALKQRGVPTGGRAFFVDRAAWTYEPFLHHLKVVPVLITEIGRMRSADRNENIVR